jgi:uncharacterized protein
MPAGTVLVTMVAALVVALLLSAGAIDRKAAGRRPNSEGRRSIAATVAGLSEALGLDRPEESLGEAVGPYLGHERAPGEETSADLAAEARAANGAALASPQPTPDAGPPRAGGSRSIAVPVPAVDPTPRLRAPTPDRPLKLWVGGDSITIELGQGLARLAGRTRLFDVVRDARASTGITRPDFFNWPEHLLRDVAPVEGGGVDPDVLVFMVGGNDDQNMPAWRGTPQAPAGSPPWLDAYRRRVGDTMDLLKSRTDDRLVIWPGMPVTQPGTLAHVREMNAIYASEAARRSWVRYFDSWPFFADVSDAYAGAPPNADGRARDLRNRDGIHLSVAGGARLARALYARLGALVDLGAAPLLPDPTEEAPASITERPAEVVTRTY